jgi:hypothetical protein
MYRDFAYVTNILNKVLHTGKLYLSANDEMQAFLSLMALLTITSPKRVGSVAKSKRKRIVYMDNGIFSFLRLVLLCIAYSAENC